MPHSLFLAFEMEEKPFPTATPQPLPPTAVVPLPPNNADDDDEDD